MKDDTTFSTDEEESPFADVEVDLDEVDLNPMLAIAGPRGAEYIFGDDLNQGRRMSWADRFTWLLGGSFLTGATAGSFYGSLLGLKMARDHRMMKHKLTAIINSSTRHGAKVAQGMGVLALFFSGFEWTIGSVRAKEDATNIMVSAMATPMLYNFRAGWRRTLVGGVAGGFAGVGLCFARHKRWLGLERVIPEDF